VIDLDCTVNLCEHVINILTGSVVNHSDLTRSLGIAYLCIRERNRVRIPHYLILLLAR